MRKLMAMLPLAVLALSLGTGQALAAGVAVGVGVEAGGGAAGGDPNEAQLKQAACATGEADLVAVVKVTEVAEPKKDEAGEKKEGENVKVNMLGLGVVRGGRGAGVEKTLTAEVTELLKGDKEAKTVRIRASTFKNGPSEYMMVAVEREFRDANGNVAGKSSYQTSMPFTLAKDKKSLVFLKVAEEKKDDAGKVTERTYKLVQPMLDGAPEKALAAVKNALKTIEEWKDPPKLSAEEQAAVEKLIKELGSDDFATREAATKALIAKGPAVKALVEAATKNPDAEIKQRAAQVLEAIKPESLKPQQDPSTGVGSGGGVIMMQNGVQMQVQMGVGQ